jgi:hypothetical protein
LALDADGCRRSGRGALLRRGSLECSPQRASRGLRRQHVEEEGPYALLIDVYFSSPLCYQRDGFAKKQGEARWPDFPLERYVGRFPEAL